MTFSTRRLQASTMLRRRDHREARNSCFTSGRGKVFSGRHHHSKSTEGQALVEFAAVVPLLFLLIVLGMNFGGLIGAWVDVANATRAAADYAILSGDSAGSPTLATSSTLAALITADLAALPTPSTTTKVCVRQYNNSNSTPVSTILETPSGACTGVASPPPDSELIVTGGSAKYVSVAVDITYYYSSFFSGSTFLGLPLTVLPSAVHQRAVMRVE